MMQEQFYHSTAWKRLARAFLSSKNYLCELCGKPAAIVHHIRHITQSNLGDRKSRSTPTICKPSVWNAITPYITARAGR